MKKLILPFFSVALLTSCASVNYTYDGKAFNRSLETISQDNLKKNLYVIAGDEMTGRDTGSPGQKKAGEYIIKQYQSMGVSHPDVTSSFYQKIPAAALNAGRRSALPDSENIMAYIKGLSLIHI